MQKPTKTEEIKQLRAYIDLLKKSADADSKASAEFSYYDGMSESCADTGGYAHGLGFVLQAFEEVAVKQVGTVESMVATVREYVTNVTAAIALLRAQEGPAGYPDHFDTDGITFMYIDGLHALTRAKSMLRGAHVAESILMRHGILGSLAFGVKR